MGYGNLLQEDLSQHTAPRRTAAASAPDPTAGHCRPTTPLETPKHSQASLAQSPVGPLILSPGSWYAQGFVCTLQESVSSVLWKFYNQIPLTFKVRFPGDSKSLCQTPRLGNLLCALVLLQYSENFFGIIVLQSEDHPPGGSMVGLMVTSSKRMYATCCASQDCCCQYPSPRGRPLLTYTSTGEAQTLTGRSGSVSYVDQCSFLWVLVYIRFCLCPLRVSGRYGV